MATQKIQGYVNGIPIYAGSDAYVASQYAAAQGAKVPAAGTLLSGNLANHPALKGGAAGGFLDLTPEEAAEKIKIDTEAMGLGVPHSEVGDYQTSIMGGRGPKTEYIIPMGIYKGMTASAAKALQTKQEAQLSPLNSLTFGSDGLNNVKNTAKNFQLSLDSTNNDPFNSKGTKKTNIDALISSATSQFADAFNSVQDFTTAYQTNPELQKTLDSYIKAGGSLGDIQSKIELKTKLPEGWDAETYANFKAANPNLEPDAEDTVNMQSTPEYLNSLAGGDTSPAAIQATRDLFVEGELAKKEIARQYNMSSQIEKLYFGDDKTIGLLENNKKIAEEKLKLIATQVENAQNSAKAQADLEIEKNNAEVEVAKASIEQNRLNAKNYMTGMLAKLGALQTTGAAPLALTTLDQKYQQQKTQLDSKLYYTNQQIRVNLKKDINDVKTKGDDAIISIKEDLSKDEETAAKEIMKAQQDAEKEIYNITKSYVKDFQTTKSKYETEAKSNADKYIASFMQLAGKGINLNRVAGMILPNGRIDTTKLTGADFAKKGPAAFSSNRFDSKDTQTFFNGLPEAFKNAWGVNFPSWEGSGKATKEALKADYAAWLKNNPGGKSGNSGDLSPANLTAGTNYILSNSDDPEGDLEKFKTDREFQAYIMGIQ